MDDKLKQLLNTTADKMKAAGKSDEDIKAAATELVSKYQEFQTQGTQAQIAGEPKTASFFDAAKAASMTSPEQFAGAMGEHASFPAPANTDVVNPLEIAARTAGNIPRSALNLFTGALNFVGEAITHPINTAESLVKDPSQIFGPAAKEIAYGLYNTAEAGLRGDRNAALNELQKGLSKANIAFQDDPLMSFFGPKFGKDLVSGTIKGGKDVVEGARDISSRTIDATRESSPSTGAQVFMREVQNIGTRAVMDNPAMNFFRSIGNIYHKANQGWVETQARKTVDQAFSMLEKEKSLTSELGFLAENEAKMQKNKATYEQALSESASAKSMTDKKRADLQSKIDEINEKTFEIQNKRAQLIEVRAEAAVRKKQLDDFAQDASARFESDLNTRTYTTPEEFNSGFTEFVDQSKKGANLIYETTLKDVNGKEIPVSPSEIVPKLVNFAETIKKTGDLELYRKYNKIAAGYVLKDLFNRFQNPERVAAEIVKNPVTREMVPTEWFSGETGYLNLRNPEVSFYMSPMYLNFIPQIRNNLAGLISESKTGAKTFFNKELEPTFKQIIIDTLSSKNPELVRAYENANEMWSGAKILEDLQKENPSSFEKLVSSRWDEISQVIPDSLKTKVQDYFTRKILADARGVNGYSVSKLVNSMKTYERILSPENTSTIYGLVDALNKSKDVSLLADQQAIKQNIEALNKQVVSARQSKREVAKDVSTAESVFDLTTEKVRQQETALKQAEEISTKAGTSIEKTVSNIGEIKDKAELDEMVSATGKTPQELLNIYIQYTTKKAETTPGGRAPGEGVSIETPHEVYKSIEQLPPVLKESMSPAQVEIYNMMKQAAIGFEKAKGLADKSVAARVLAGTIAIVSLSLSYPLTGLRAAETAVAPGKAAPDINPRTVGMPKSKKAKTSPRIPTLKAYLGAGSKVMNRELTDEERAALEEQYYSQFGQ